jgi:GNAT superfamily N-acetyltransferase
MRELTDLECMILGHLNLAEFNREIARWSGDRGEIYEADGVLCYASGSTAPQIVNGVQRLDPWVDPRRALDVADAWFRARGRGYTIFIPTHEQDFVDAARARGIEPPLTATTPEMVCRSKPDTRSLAEGIELRWVVDEAGIRDFCTVNEVAFSPDGTPTTMFRDVTRDANRFAAPHVRTVVAYEGERALATAQALYSHGIAGVFAVGTLPEARGKGLGDAVTRAVTCRAFEEGAAMVSLQASAMGAPIYQRMGYVRLFDYAYTVNMLQP